MELHVEGMQKSHQRHAMGSSSHNIFRFAWSCRYLVTWLGHDWWQLLSGKRSLLFARLKQICKIELLFFFKIYTIIFKTLPTHSLYRCLRLFLNFMSKHRNKIPNSSNLILPTTKITPCWWAFCAWSMILSWRTSSLNPRRWMPSFRKSKRVVASKRRREVNGPHTKPDRIFSCFVRQKNVGNACFKMRGFKSLILR